MIHHLESHLGKMDRGWSSNAAHSSIQVGLFKNQPQAGINTYCTIGLSHQILTMKDNKQVRQELIFSAYDKYEDKSLNISSSLISFAEHISNTQKALLRGEVIGPGEPFIKGTKLVGLYCSLPVFFEDTLAVFKETSPPIVFVWVFGVTAAEISYIKNNGWNDFEDTLEISEIDFWDVERSSLLG